MTDHTREALTETLMRHGDSGRVNSRDHTVECLCGEWLDVGPFADPAMGYPDADIEQQVRARHLAAHVAAVVADKDAEIERLREYAPSPEMEALLARSSLGTDEAEAARDSVSPDAGRAVVRMAELMRERDAAVDRLGAVGALADEIIADDDMPWGQRRTAERFIAVLGDSADATTKREQEIRADEREKIRRAIRSAGDRHTTAAREDHGPIVSAAVRSAFDAAAIIALTPDESPDARADALTDTTTAPTTDDGFMPNHDNRRNR